jgi:hypothetical protein
MRGARKAADSPILTALGKENWGGDQQWLGKGCWLALPLSSVAVLSIEEGRR